MTGARFKATLAALGRRPATRPIMPRALFDRRSTFALVAATVAVILAFAYLDPLAAAWQRELPRWLVRIFRNLTDLGNSGLVLWPTGILILVLGFLQGPWIGRTANAVIAALIARLGLVFLAVAVPGLIATIGKRLIGRLRPRAFEMQGHLAFDPFAWEAAAASFPSGHATTAFAAALVLGTLWPRARVPLFLLAALIAFSRVVVGSHYLSDVIAGAMFGTVAAALVVRGFAARRIALRVAPDGRIGPMPGPSAPRLAALAAAVVGALRRRAAEIRK